MDIYDIDVSLLGPYAFLLETDNKVCIFKGSSSTAAGSNPNPSTTSKTASELRNKKLQFEAIHKKIGLKFDQCCDTRRQDRAANFQEGVKERRLRTSMSKRIPNMAGVSNGNYLNLVISEDSMNENNAMECSNSGSEPSNLETSSDSKKGTKLAEKGNSNGQPKNVVINGNNNNTNGTTINTRNGNNTVTAPKHVMGAARRVQLQKWRKERDAAIEKTKMTQKQPFKAGAVPLAAPATIPVASKNASAASLSKNNSSTSTLSAKAPKPIIPPTKPHPATKAVNAPPAAKTAPKPDDARRVTRAMTRGQATSNGTSVSKPVVNGRTVAGTGTVGGVQTTVQRMKNLNITEKTGSSTAKSGVSVAGTSKTITNKQKFGIGPSTSSQTVKLAANQKNQTSYSSKAPVVTQPPQNTQLPSKVKSTLKTQLTPKTSSQHSSPNSSTSSSNSQLKSSKESTNTSCTLVPEKQEAPKKKLKPKAIDATYISYNSSFSTACQKLGTFGETWTKLLEEPSEKMSDKVQGDIRSALGKVKLLLESKLPQFGQLLYSYLCQEVDPNRVLACDLEGWWDVVSIQLEAVDSIFEGLQRLRNNNWKELPTVQIPRVGIGAKPDTVVDKNQLSRPTSKFPVKAQASSGLKALMASRRKMLQNPNAGNNGEAVEHIPMVVEDNAPTVENQASTLILDKTFEGGFFTINSPKLGTTPDVHKNHDRDAAHSFSVPSIPKTPNRRLSLRQSESRDAERRVSMGILGVRRSMGSFRKIGAVPILAEDKSSSTSSTISDNDN